MKKYTVPHELQSGFREIRHFSAWVKEGGAAPAPRGNVSYMPSGTPSIERRYIVYGQSLGDPDIFIGTPYPPAILGRRVTIRMSKRIHASEILRRKTIHHSPLRIVAQERGETAATHSGR